MDAKFVLHGNSTQESMVAQQMLDSMGIEYRFEGETHPYESPTLVTPAGRFRGLDAIRGLFGGRKGKGVSP